MARREEASSRDRRRDPLADYHRKRDFGQTPEPAGKAAKSAGPDLAFVVQKHDASRLHYDFRLELGGVLKSWAVPKGPSLDPADRRLAVATEDHPLEYGDFEGVIPQREYGGGTVLLWDRGRWLPEGGEEGAEKAHRKGRLRFELAGEKMRGRWTLARMSGSAAGDGKNWLLIKGSDEAARPGAGEALLEERPESAVSGRTIEEIAADPERVWRSGDGGAEEVPEAERRPRRDGGEALDPAALPGARRGPLPKDPRPALATLTDRVPAGDRWLHEIKHDGYRALCRLAGTGRRRRVRLLTRNGKDWTDRFPAVAAAAAELPVEAALLDGEVVALAADGSSSFAALQQALGRHAGGPLVCYLFDLLHLDGIDLTACPLEQRKSLLARLLARAGRDETTTLRFSDHVVGRGAEFHRQACRHGLEGVVSKRREAPYHPGRHRDWLKIRCSQRQELVIGGFTEPSGSRAGLGSLILGVYPVPGAAAQGGKLAHAGRVGTGFDRRTLTALRGRLEALETDEAPFADPRAAAAGGSRRGVHWVRPELVCEVAFTEWTADGVLRHPSFQGLREDEPAEEVVREMPVARAEKPEGPARGRQGAARRGGRRGSTVEVAGVRITHPERVLYPEPGVTKRDLAAYYAGVADRMLPHLAGRPLSLVRCPQGQPGDCFFQKHIDGSFPAAVRRIAVTEKGGARKTYAVADDRDALLSLVQMGVLELHTWGARADRLDRPDVLVFDLDPDEGLDWKHVVTGARAVRGLLAELGLTSFAKTTGGKGLHVVVPIERRTGWDEVREFTRGVAEAIVRAAPERFVATMSKAQRQGKVFIDYLRNARGATFIAPYSSRARPGATVAAPVSWDEIGRLRPGGYTVTNLARRLARREADPWADWGSTRQSLTRAMRRAVGG